MERILLLGSGGREHALAWKIAQSPKLEKLFIAPGNAGTALVGENVAMKADDFDAIKAFVLANAITMVVVGPEDPLVKGIYDYFKTDAELASIPVVGPSKQGAVLEGSKDFAKGFMQRHGIPTAAYDELFSATVKIIDELLESFLRVEDITSVVSSLKLITILVNVIDEVSLVSKGETDSLVEICKFTKTCSERVILVYSCNLEDLRIRMEGNDCTSILSLTDNLNRLVRLTLRILLYEYLSFTMNLSLEIIRKCVHAGHTYTMEST